MNQGLKSGAKISNLDETQREGKIYARSDKQDNHKRKVAYDWKFPVEGKIRWEVPNHIRQRLKNGAYLADKIFHQ